jgi:hypothetical protein
MSFPPRGTSPHSPHSGNSSHSPQASEASMYGPREVSDKQPRTKKNKNKKKEHGEKTHSKLAEDANIVRSAASVRLRG